MDKIFWKIVPVYVNDDNADGPEYAIINLDASQIKRIHKLATAAKKLKIAYIEDWDCSAELMTSEIDFVEHIFSEENPWKVVTDKTPLKKLGLLVNHENEIVKILVKQRLAGYSVHSQETLQELRSLMNAYEESVDCQTLQVSNNDLIYKGSLKHTNITYNTDGISLKDLPKLT